MTKYRNFVEVIVTGWVADEKGCKHGKEIQEVFTVNRGQDAICEAFKRFEAFRGCNRMTFAIIGFKKQSIAYYEQIKKKEIGLIEGVVY